jgi:signal transduction histidine kinase
MLTRQVRDLARADLVVLAVPEPDHRMLAIRFAEGDGAEAAHGLVLAAKHSLSGEVLNTGLPIEVEDFARDSRTATPVRGPMGHIGPAMLFPLGVAGDVRGVLTVGRRHGSLPFPETTADVVGTFAAQAGIALELANRRRDAERLSLYEDRDRIARDLHDHAIQRLYAAGMTLEGTMPMIGKPEVQARVRKTVEAMDATIKDIRVAIFSLQTSAEDEPPNLREAVFTLIEETTPAAGFGPSLRLGAKLNDQVVSREAGEAMLSALREALSNAGRHAQAAQIDVSIDVDTDGCLVMRVSDDGIGIADGGRRSGLRNLQTRAEKLGGVLRLEPGSSGTGTELTWRVPAGDRR